MRLEKVRVGERFVYGDRAGVWQKVSYRMAKCVYGAEHDKEVEVVPETPVFVFIDQNKFSRFPSQPQPNQGTGLKIVVISEDDETLLEIPEATAAQVAAYINVEGIRLKATDEKSVRVSDTIIDHENRTVYVIVA